MLRVRLAAQLLVKVKTMTYKWIVDSTVGGDLGVAYLVHKPGDRDDFLMFLSKNPPDAAEYPNLWGGSVVTADGGLINSPHFANKDDAQRCLEAMHNLGWDSNEWLPFQVDELHAAVALLVENSRTVAEVEAGLRELKAVFMAEYGAVNFEQLANNANKYWEDVRQHANSN